MKTVIDDFETRVQEIEKYFMFLEYLIDESSQHKNKIQFVDDDLVKILKANGFLILYNLIESSMRNAIEAIFDELKNKRVSFDSVKKGIKKIVIQNLKNRSPDDVHTKIKDISVDIISVGFDSKKLFSGNK